MKAATMRSGRGFSFLAGRMAVIQVAEFARNLHWSSSIPRFLFRFRVLQHFRSCGF